MDTLKELHAYLVAEFSVKSGALAPDENLLGRGLIDSMGLVKLVTHLEEHYGIEIPENDLVPENFATLEKISDYVQRNARR